MSLYPKRNQIKRENHFSNMAQSKQKKIVQNNPKMAQNNQKLTQKWGSRPPATLVHPPDPIFWSIFDCFESFLDCFRSFSSCFETFLIIGTKWTYRSGHKKFVFDRRTCSAEGLDKNLRASPVILFLANFFSDAPPSPYLRS